MRLAAEILLVGALVWLGWEKPFSQWIHGPPPTVAQRNVAQARVAARPAPNPAKRILCPACKGEKVVVYDSTGSGRLIDHRTQSCPVCLGKGYRMLVIPSGKKLCPDCQGMGIVYYPEERGHPIRSDNCNRCGATGSIADVR